MLWSISKYLFIVILAVSVSCVFSPPESNYYGISGFQQEYSTILWPYGISYLPGNRAIITGNDNFEIVDLSGGIQLLHESEFGDAFYDADYSEEQNSIYIAMYSYPDYNVLQILDLSTYEIMDLVKLTGYKSGSKLCVDGDTIYLIARQENPEEYHLLALDINDYSIKNSLYLFSIGNKHVVDFVVSDESILIGIDDQSAGGDGTLLKIDRNSFSILESTTIEYGLNGFGYDPLRNLLVLSFRSKIEVWNFDTYEVLRVIDDAARAGLIQINSDEGLAYMAGSSEVYAIDLNHMEVVYTIVNGFNSWCRYRLAEISPDGSSMLLVEKDDDVLYFLE